MTIRGAKSNYLVLLAVVVITLSGCMVAGTNGNASDTSTSDRSPSSSGTSSTSVSTPDTSDGLTIDDGVFAYSEEDNVSNETFVVTGTPDQAKVIKALVAAGNRFMLVDETGVEHPDQAGADAARMADLYTPNYVADPKVTPDGVQLYVDCKSSIEDPMAQTFRKILREELTSAGIRGRVRAVSY